MKKGADSIAGLWSSEIIIGRATFRDPPDTLFIHPSHSHATGCAQCGENCRDDACKNLQECLYAFFLHSRLVFVLILRFLIRGEGLSHQTSDISPLPSAISSRSRCRRRRLREDWWCHHRPDSHCHPGSDCHPDFLTPRFHSRESPPSARCRAGC